MRQWFARSVVVVFAGALGIIGTVGSLAAPVAEGGRGSGGARVDSEECRLLADVNKFRRQHNLQPLDLDRDLNEAADHHSQDMAKHDYFSHKLHDGTTASENIRDFGYKENPIGENIFAGSAQAGTAFKWWENSAGHRRAMLNQDFEAIGIGRASDPKSEYGWYWTTTFGGSVENKDKC